LTTRAHRHDPPHSCTNENSGLGASNAIRETMQEARGKRQVDWLSC
jgi:hypothetical protein